MQDLSIDYKEAAQNLIDSFEPYSESELTRSQLALKTATEIRDNVVMYTGGLNHRWKYWNDIVELLVKAVNINQGVQDGILRRIKMMGLEENKPIIVAVPTTEDVLKEAENVLESEEFAKQWEECKSSILGNTPITEIPIILTNPYSKLNNSVFTPPITRKERRKAERDLKKKKKFHLRQKAENHTNMLFELPKKIKPKTDPRRCKSCKFIIIEEYRTGSRFFYCRAKQSKRTANGLLKIKANDSVCEQYRENG